MEILTEIATYFNGMPNLVILRRVPWIHLFQGVFINAHFRFLDFKGSFLSLIFEF